MKKFTVISNHDQMIRADHVYATTGDAALITVALARQGCELIVAIPGHFSESYTVEGVTPDRGLAFPGECIVDGSQLIADACDNDGDALAVIRALVHDQGFEIKEVDGSYYWSARNWVEDGPVCDSEAEALDSCVVTNDLEIAFNTDGSLGPKDRFNN